ncbi:hypothetical protein NG99_11835 [Erwinia typographi]|uniref:Flagellar protein n=1 Tax=Erwinia typographi TaxID=371042 RepID=A0A0A3Z2M0_9GAMM|nr:flagellar biosynthetic protein FliO [Erwinia typographi]KGT93347.1 hypothetical protein NG99_11835 [Erwinia typographi]
MNSQTQTDVQIPAALHDTGTPGSMLFTVSGALVLVLLFIVALAWIARRFGFTAAAARGHKLLAVKSSLAIGQRERVVVVEIDRQWLVLGVSAAGIALLTTLEKKELVETAVPAVDGDFQAMLKNLLGRKAGEPS